MNFSSLPKCFFCIASFWCFGLSVVAQDDGPTKKEPPFSQPPELEQAFDDDFANDARANYEIKGDVTWEKGKLTLGEGSVLQRKLEGSGPWIEMYLDLEFPKLTKDGESSELKIWLDLEDETDSFVLFRQFRAGGKTRSEISIANSDGNWDANPETEPVRKPLKVDSGLPSGSWNVGNRNGLWLVRRDQKIWFAAHIKTGNARPVAFVVQSDKSASWFQRICLAQSKKKEAKFSNSEKAKLAKVEQFRKRITAHFQKRELNDALPFASQNAEIRKEVLGQFHPDYAKSLNTLAVLHQSIGSYDKAEKLHIEAIQLRERVLGKEHPSYSTSVNSLGRLYVAMGAFEQAEQLFLEAIQLGEIVLDKEDTWYATCLMNLGVVYASTGAYEKAEPFFIEAQQIEAKVQGTEHPSYAHNLNNLASLYTYMGALEKAESLYLEATQIRKRTLGTGHPDYASSLSNLGSLYAKMGDYQNAEPLILEAMQVQEKVLGKGHLEYASSLTFLANLYVGMNAFKKAESLFLEAKQIEESVLGLEHPGYATTLNNLANIYSSLDDFEQAEPLFREAMNIREKVFGKEHPAYAASLNNLAGLYFSIGAYEEAKPLYLEAKRIEEKVVGLEHPSYAATLASLALLYAAMEDFEQAESLSLAAMRITEKVRGNKHPEFASSLDYLAGLYHSMGVLSKAEPLFRESITITQANFERYAVIQTESQQLEYQNYFQSRLSEFLTVTGKLKKDPTRAFELLMNWKGQTQIRQSTYRSIGNDKEITKLFADYRSVSQRLFKHLEHDSTATTWKDRLNNLTLEKESIEKELAAKSAKFAQTKEQINLKQIQDTLPDRAVFVNFHQYRYLKHVDRKLVYDNRLLAFVLHATGKVKMINLGESDSIFQAVQDWRTIFDPSQDTLANQKKAELAADLLRKRLWQPVEQHFEKGVTTVLISPDGELGTLPFPALPGKNRDSYLINEYQIAIIPVPRLLAEIAEKESIGPRNPKVLLVGDVDYASTVKPTDDATQLVAARWRGMKDVLQGDWAQLTQTGIEVEQIRDLLISTESTTPGSIQILKQKQASEFLFRDISPRFNILHIATHGFFADPKFETIDTTDQLKNEGRPGRSNQRFESAKYYNLHHPGILSGLVFAGANKKNKAPDADDGIMTADEISVLQLKDVDLVTLSACETGLGKSAGGEGLIGIQRAFQISGARTTVASLWKVDDLATRKLMERFYRNMFEKKMGKLAALTEAQRWLLNNPNEHSDIVRGKRKLTTDKSKIRPGNVKSLPARYWAAWILAGDWR